MVVDIGVAARTLMCDAFVDQIDAGAAAGRVEIRTGTQPATPATAASGTLLATLTFTDPAFGAASNGSATASAITSDTNVDTSGTAGYFRILDSNNVCHAQGSCGTSGADLNFNTVTFVAGGTAAITSMTASVAMN